jgi:hypothetical protein
MVDLIVYELLLILELFKQSRKILDNCPFKIKNYVTNAILIINNFELNSVVKTSN